VFLLCACGADAAGKTARDSGPVGPLPTSGADAGEYEFPCLESRPVTRAPTFTAIYHEIFCNSGCADIYCHGARGASGGMNLETLDAAYASLVRSPAGSESSTDAAGCMASGLRRVQPGDPERSLFYLKVHGAPPCGLPMPPPSTVWPALDAMQQAQIAAWITAGSKDDRLPRTEDAGAL
jgi:hypothetical protein